MIIKQATSLSSLRQKLNNSNVGKKINSVYGSDPRALPKVKQFTKNRIADFKNEFFQYDPKKYKEYRDRM